jgi:hypothetical protein
MTDVRMLQAPGDPGEAGLLVVLAIVLVLGLAFAHLRLLRAVGRAARATTPSSAEPLQAGQPAHGRPPPPP